MNNEIRSENWTIELYPDNEKHMKILEYIKLNFEYAYILHNCDVYVDNIIDKNTGEIKHKKGELKKAHYHVIILLKNARTLKSIVDELGIEENLVEKVKSKKAMFRYLCHLDNPEKTEYDKDEISSNVKILVNKYCSKDKETQDVLSIYEYIYSIDKYLYHHEIFEYAIRNEIYANYRRNATIISRLVDEHNKLFLERKESEKINKARRDKEIWEYEKQHSMNRTKESKNQ